uniref:Uncharacterized protein n=1 Tax=Anguilla anguilla TaxID=7936 RepID=A0A0E9T7J1_ANGAN
MFACLSQKHFYLSCTGLLFVFSKMALINESFTNLAISRAWVLTRLFGEAPALGVSIRFKSQMFLPSHVH